MLNCNALQKDCLAHLDHFIGLVNSGRIVAKKIKVVWLIMWNTRNDKRFPKRGYLR